MLLGVISAVRMKLGAVSGVYVRLVVKWLVHIGIMCLGALSFADQNFGSRSCADDLFATGHASVLTSLQVTASFGQDLCCLFTVLLGRGIFPLVTLLVPSCVGLRDGHSDQHLLMIICSLWRYVDARVLVNETVHRSSFSLFTLSFTNAAKLAKSSFLHFKFPNSFCSKHNR
jgi:hypothetical protein